MSASDSIGPLPPPGARRGVDPLARVARPRRTEREERPRERGRQREQSGRRESAPPAPGPDDDSPTTIDVRA